MVHSNASAVTGARTRYATPSTNVASRTHVAIAIVPTDFCGYVRALAHAAVHFAAPFGPEGKARAVEKRPTEAAGRVERHPLRRRAVQNQLGVELVPLYYNADQTQWPFELRDDVIEALDEYFDGYTEQSCAAS